MGFLFLVIAVGVFADSVMTDSELIYVHMIWRHGDRGPLHNFPGFSEKYEAEWPKGNGHLTELGEHQAQHLGKLIKERYFDSGKHTSKDVFLRSTKFDRTIETAKNVLIGMGMKEVAVPANIESKDDFEGFAMFKCPKAEDLVNKMGDAYLMRDQYPEVYKLAKENLGYEGSMYAVFDMILTMKAHNLELPDWMADDDLFQKLKKLSWIEREKNLGIGQFNNAQLIKLRGGTILRGIVERIACKLNVSSGPEAAVKCDEFFYGLSSHFPTMEAAFSTYENFHDVLGVVPLIDYSANVAHEVWRINDQYKLKVLYANRYDEQPKDITKFVIGCAGADQNLCDVHAFIDASRAIFVDDIHEACQLDIIHHIDQRQNPEFS